MFDLPGLKAASADCRFRWGIYEKALPRGEAWPDLLRRAARAGYHFVEISIDESDERLCRLDWSRAERRTLHEAIAAAPVTIDTMCLSGHRRYALGSVSAPQREQAHAIMRRAIDFAAEFGIRIVQVAGYDVHYEESTERTRALYLESIRTCAAWARESCVMLGLENVDCPMVDSIEAGMRIVEAMDTPWFQMYPDIGNLAAQGKDVPAELARGGRSIVGLHLKDTRRMEFRRVPFGAGIVDFDAAFRALKAMDYRGPFVVEMWSEATPDPEAAAACARNWLGQRLNKAFDDQSPG